MLQCIIYLILEDTWFLLSTIETLGVVRLGSG